MLGLILGLSIEGLRSKDHLRHSRYFSVFYEGLRTERRAGLLYPGLFIARRVVFCLSALFLEEYPVVQVQMVLMGSMCHLVHLAHWKPFISSAKNNLEFANEAVVLLVAGTLLGCTDAYTGGQEAKHAMGWVVFGVISTQALMNAGY